MQGKSVDQERKYRDEKEELLKAIATREEEKRAVLSELTLKEAQAKALIEKHQQDAQTKLSAIKQEMQITIVKWNKNC